MTDGEGPRKSYDHYDGTGDLEIMTSDGVLFKVHAYYLQAVS